MIFSMIFSNLAFAQGTSSTDTITYDQKFSDVEINDVEVIYLYDKGIILGNPDGTVKSTNSLTRAEVVTIFSRYFEFGKISNTSSKAFAR